MPLKKETGTHSEALKNLESALSYHYSQVHSELKSLYLLDHIYGLNQTA